MLGIIKYRKSNMDTQQLLEAVRTVEVIQSIISDKPNEWLPVFAAVGGAFVGAISTFFPTLLIERNKKRQEAKTVLFALVAEISALLKIIEVRNYIESIQNIIKHLEANPEFTHSFKVHVPDHYSRVYQSHVSNLGLLEIKQATQIIEFHQMIDAIVQDIKPGGLIAENHVGVESYREMLSIFEAAREIGSEIVKTNA